MSIEHFAKNILAQLQLLADAAKQAATNEDGRAAEDMIAGIDQDHDRAKQQVTTSLNAIIEQAYAQGKAAEAKRIRTVLGIMLPSDA